MTQGSGFPLRLWCRYDGEDRVDTTTGWFIDDGLDHPRRAPTHEEDRQLRRQAQIENRRKLERRKKEKARQPTKKPLIRRKRRLFHRTAAKREKKHKEFRQVYHEYLRSPQWRAFREAILIERGRKCEWCARTKGTMDIHHKTYARIFKERKSDVVVICRPCHDKHHGK